MKKTKLLQQLHTELNALPIPNVMEKSRLATPIVIKEETNKPVPALKRRVLAGSFAFMFFVMILASALFPVLFGQSSTTLSIDINPSLELTLNKNETVVNAVAVNDDAVNLLSQINLIGSSLDLALDNLLNKALENGYLVEREENAILFGIKNKNSNIKNKLEEKLNEKTNAYFNAHNMAGGAIFAEYKNELKKEFEELKNSFEEDVNISPVKYLYIKQIIERFPSLAGHEEYLAKMNIKELNKLLTNNQTAQNILELINIILQNRPGNGNANSNGNGK